MIKIGLEIHCQLTTIKSKLFCSCDSNHRKYKPNLNTCPICLGIPGTLPLINKNAIKKSLLLALALNCKIPEKTLFCRKNYFYPDLPKNFQITQFNMEDKHSSIGYEGHVAIENKIININRIQLEEDPGRINYVKISDKSKLTLIDYNRSGVSLVEIVTQPDFSNNVEIKEFLSYLSNLLIQLDISDPTLPGAMRTDVNISIDDHNKIELKNINSIHDLEKAVDFEIVRQSNFITRNLQIQQETRHWDEKRKITTLARRKEDEQDYRYIIEQDIPSITISPYLISKLKNKIPENIKSKKSHYMKFGISNQVLDTILSDLYYTRLFESAFDGQNAKNIANIIATDLIRYLNTDEKKSKSKLTATHLIRLSELIDTNKIKRDLIKNILRQAIVTGNSIDVILNELKLHKTLDEDKLSIIIDNVIESEHDLIKKININPNVINYLIGKIMKKAGNVQPKAIINLLNTKIKLNVKK